MTSTVYKEATQDEKSNLLPDTSGARSSEPVTNRWIPIEPLAAVYFFVALQGSAFAQFYTIDKLAEKYGLNSSGNSSEQSVCSSSAKTPGNMGVQDKIQAEAADFTAYLLICASIPGILQTFVLGTLSDRYGRKIAMLVPLCGSLIKYIIFTIVFVLNLPVSYLFLGAAFDGLSGSTGAMITALTVAIIDVTPTGPRRVLRITVLQACLNLGYAVGTATLGPWIEAMGYKQPAYVITGILVAAVLFTLIFMPETRPMCNDTRSFRDHLAHIKTSFTLFVNDTHDNRRWKLIVCLVTFIFSFAVEMVKGTTLILFLLAAPLCWSKSKVTTYNGVRVLLNWVCILTFTRLVRRHLQEPTIAIIGCISYVLFLLTIGFADNTALAITAAAVGLLSEAPLPMMRSTISRLVSSDEQGALFATVSSVELLVTAVIGVFAAQIYKASISFFPGLIFIILAALIMVTGLMLVPLAYSFWKQQKGEEKDISPGCTSDATTSKLESSSRVNYKSCE